LFLEPGAVMSLSKHFKHSDSFQPEDIFKTAVKKDQASHFQADKTDSLPNLSHPLLQVDHSTPQQSAADNQQPASAPSPENKETEPPSDSPDPDKYIEISAMESKLKEAFEAGARNGHDKAEEDFGSAVNSLISVCRQLDTIRETIIANSSREMQEFALAVAERIIRISLRDNNTIIATIEEALQRALKSEEFYVYIHPDDYDTVVEKSSDLIAGVSGLNNIVIKKDATVEKGGAKIESDNCIIDATVASQFEMIQEEMKKRL